MPFLLLAPPPELLRHEVQRGYFASLPSSFAKPRKKMEKIKKIKSLDFFPLSISNTVRIAKSELLFLRYFLDYIVLIKK